MELIHVINEAFQAAQSGDALRLKELLESYPSLTDTENSDGLTLLGFAAHYGHADAVQVLLDHGAGINAISHSKVSFILSNTALHAAIVGERNTDVIRLLLSHQARTHIQDSDGHTCLHTAAYHDNQPEIIRLLMEHGADVNAKGTDGETALSLAVQQGHQNVAEYLRQHGATS
ncbi:ankyrin repeat protein [Paenibacillus sp. RC254]|uniref:ankyrin repeat domain-containing protein n=1 Tax=unclassified Paenibacillus TaxID=185978 RepID=UPI0024B9EB1A|nr:MULTISPECIES: ankyrin repeat domain-containing protein [unclassified Paenibacillus]